MPDAAEDNSDRNPNIIYIMADDMGYGDPGCYGSEKIPTPNIDELAEDGVRFTDAHSASAVCTPSRYAAVTGRYCWRTRLKSGVMWGHSPPLIESERTTVASMLGAEGYATAAVGKWHLGLGWNWKDGIPDDRSAIREETGENIDYERPLTFTANDVGFDYFFGIPASLDMQPYCFIENHETVGVPSVEKDPYQPQQRDGMMVPGWRDDQVDMKHAEKACKFIETSIANDPDRPFFLYLVPSVPHRPCVPPGFMKGASDAGLRGDCVAVYDWVVGQIMETLDKLDIADNTLMLVTSDNGARLVDYYGKDYGHQSCGDLRGQKADIWDGGHREPFVARWPNKIEAGSTCDETICFSDLMATSADIIGAELADDAAEDSYSVLPALLDEELDEPIREATVHHSGRGMFSIRQGPWKLIRGLGSGGFSEPRELEPEPDQPEGQLYNMQQDHRETTTLWGEEPEIVERLSGLLDRYIHEGRSVPKR